MIEPSTPAEWQEAADAAVFALGLDSAWAYGLVTPDPQVDVARCEAVLAEAPSHGAVIRTLEQVLALERRPGARRGLPTEDEVLAAVARFDGAPTVMEVNRALGLEWQQRGTTRNRLISLLGQARLELVPGPGPFRFRVTPAP